MMCFAGGSAWRRLMLLGTPLLVVGMLVWQRQEGRASVDRHSQSLASGSLSDPPSGVSADEWRAARIEFEGVVDSTLQCGVAEMPTYWRLLKWNARQQAAANKPAEYSRVGFDDLVNRPSVWRARPVQVDLHICRIVECAAPTNSFNIERVYEVWGWSDDSRGSLYVAVTPELPAGMSVGDAVNERATVSGYFYKVQGYLAAGAAAQAIPAAAPLIIGRLSRWDAPAPAMVSSRELWLAAAGVLLAVSFGFLLSQTSLVRGGRQRQQVRPKAAAKLESWVDSFAADLADGPA